MVAQSRSRAAQAGFRWPPLLAGAFQGWEGNGQKETPFPRGQDLWCMVESLRQVRRVRTLGPIPQMKELRPNLWSYWSRRSHDGDVAEAGFEA